jgi:histidinol-phosphate aminotransferase
MSAHIEPRDDLRALEGYHSAQLDVAVRLNTNESPFPPPSRFLDAWTTAIREHDYHRYPDRAASELRTAIGAAFGQPESRVFAANGSNEVLQTLLFTYGGARRSCLVFEPTYALHSHIARLSATTVVEGDRGDDFRIDARDAAERIRALRPAVTFVCSPNNPTGTVEPRATVDAMLAAVSDVHGILVVDEAYGDFADWTAIDRVDDDTPLVVVRTYSKVWSLAGLRLGFCLGPEWAITELDKVVLPYHLSIEKQLAGVLALDYDEEMRARVATLVEERGRITRLLQEIDGITVFPSGANFVLFRVGGDAAAVWKAMVARGVLVRDFSRWPRVEECLRVTIGTTTENDAMLAALRAAMTEVGIV